ncbi:hypothetical protein GCM10009021_02910 [Halarchaeum nitratireducens]|uniref:Uncharacterized protein n=2 Tax=Halarchaeum nitratireducens TaxID=489913 RepID=A0A830G7U8_9EURY|nr:hypothetical protein GCM10009021_02910 [Halarchaeum nitratireducens]
MFYYDEDDWTTIYVRDDLATERLRDSVPNIVERTREARALVREDDYERLGETTATTEVHDSGVVLHFPREDRRGVIISLDREAARRLSAFVSQCATILQSPPPSAFEARSATD